MNTDFWLDKITRESQHTRKLRHLSAKQVELFCTFYNNFLPPATSWFVARQVWFVGGKTRKTAFQHVCSNVAKQGARFCGLIYRIFTLNKNDNHESREVQGIIGFFILLGEHEYHIFLCHTLGGSPPAAPFVLFASNRDVEKASITKEWEWTHILLVCTLRHGGHVGGQEQNHFSPLETKLYFHVNCSRKNSIVSTTNMAALSRGCKPRVERFHSRGQQFCKFVGTKEIKRFNSHRTGLGHQPGRRFIVLENQYGGRDVMWKRSIG